MCFACGVAVSSGGAQFPWGAMETPSQHWHWITGIHVVIITHTDTQMFTYIQVLTQMLFYPSMLISLSSAQYSYYLLVIATPKYLFGSGC